MRKVRMVRTVAPAIAVVKRPFDPIPTTHHPAADVLSQWAELWLKGLLVQARVAVGELCMVDIHPSLASRLVF